MSAKTTFDHREIQRWAMKRNGKPSKVKGTEGFLRINFSGGRADTLEQITWEDFFKIFDKKKLLFLYQEKTKNGRQSRFFKLVKGK